MFIEDDERLCREEHAVTNAICEIPNEGVDPENPQHGGPHIGRVEAAWVLWDDDAWQWEGTVTLPPRSIEEREQP